MTPEQLAALPHDSLGPKLNAIIWSLTAIAAVFLGLRLYCRAVISKVLWWDDWLLLAAWLAIFTGSVITSITVGMGYGKHIWDVPFEELGNMFKVFSVAGTFSICSSVWSKTSFALTILRLTDGWLRKAIWAIIITMNLFMAGTALINYIRCSPLDKLWDFTGAVPGTCWPMDVVNKYNTFSAVYSGLVDITLALIPWTLIWNLQMRMDEKIGVAVAMSMGIFAGATAFVKAAYLPRMASPDIYDSVDLSWWSNIECTVSIMAASIPILRVLLKDVKKTVFTRGYHGSSSDPNSKTKGTRKMWTVNNTEVMVTAGRRDSRRNSEDTDGSELNILNGEVSTSTKGDVIIQKTDYTVKYESRESV
ncbi:hypothetical protein V8F20_006364 [Naviculisporaceae sp. PSN 640]